MQTHSPKVGVGINSRAMKQHMRLALFAACCLASAASAQWQWLDKDGRPVFSDRAPPPNVPEKSIRQRPLGAPIPVTPHAAQTQANPTGEAAQTSASAPNVVGIDKELAEKKKKAQADEAAQRKAEEDRLSAARADNCKRARAAKAGIDSGVRLSRLNAQGEREILDDAARAAESKRVQAIIDSDCR